MGLFDIFRKKKTDNQEEEGNQQASRVSSESLSDQTSDQLLEEQHDVQSELDKSEAPVVKSPETETETETEIESEQQVYNKGLEKTRTGFAARFNKFLANFRSVDEDFFEELEETLVGADVGFDMAIKISDELREEVKLENAKRKEDVRDVIIKKMVDL